MTEFRLSCEVARYLDLVLPDDIAWSHIGHGEIRDKRTASKLKVMGLKPGVADFLVFTNPLLCIELKFGRNNLTEHQKEFARKVETQDHIYVVARTIEEVAEALLGVMGSRLKPHRLAS